MEIPFMTSREELDRLLNKLLNDAISLWHRDGAVMTTSWAAGPETAIFAGPDLENGASVSDETRIGVLALMGKATDAKYVGRIDEAWIKELGSTEELETIERGDLQKESETDPRVRTCIVVEGWDVYRERGRAHVAVLELKDDGEAQWHAERLDDPRGRVADEQRFAVEIMGKLPDPSDLEFTLDILRALGWVVAIANTSEIASEE